LTEPRSTDLGSGRGLIGVRWPERRRAAWLGCCGYPDAGHSLFVPHLLGLRGAPSLAVHFRRECELIEQRIELARAAENPELSFRLLGNAHEDVVTALETYLKTVYRYLVKKRLVGEDAARLVTAKAVGNTIERARKSSRRWRSIHSRSSTTATSPSFARTSRSAMFSGTTSASQARSTPRWRAVSSLQADRELGASAAEQPSSKATPGIADRARHLASVAELPSRRPPTRRTVPRRGVAKRSRRRGRLLASDPP
jgi:hypothetical protein